MGRRARAHAVLGARGMDGCHCPLPCGWDADPGFVTVVLRLGVPCPSWEVALSVTFSGSWCDKAPHGCLCRGAFSVDGRCRRNRTRGIGKAGVLDLGQGSDGHDPDTDDDDAVEGEGGEEDDDEEALGFPWKVALAAASVGAAVGAIALLWAKRRR